MKYSDFQMAAAVKIKEHVAALPLRHGSLAIPVSDAFWQATILADVAELNMSFADDAIQYCKLLWWYCLLARHARNVEHHYRQYVRHVRFGLLAGLLMMDAIVHSWPAVYLLSVVLFLSWTARSRWHRRRVDKIEIAIAHHLACFHGEWARASCVNRSALEAQSNGLPPWLAKQMFDIRPTMKIIIESAARSIHP